VSSPIRIGCCSWTSEAWWGRVYPRGLADGERLAFYARLFDTVEVDSTYYRTPSRALVEGWRRKTPETFRFSLKFPRDLLDPKSPVDEDGVAEFLTNARALGAKLGPILLQFPPWVRPGRADAFLGSLLKRLDPTMAFAVELRDVGWYQGETWDRLRRELIDRKVALAWSYLTYLEIPPELTADFVYLRFIGDHETVSAERHGEVRVDRSQETARWAERVLKRREEVQYTFVVFNNHYAGFAPASANEFRAQVGLEPIDFGRWARGAQRLEDSVGSDGT
jgi:uncharacterized protein YecE (DUF72 family)